MEKQNANQTKSMSDYRASQENVQPSTIDREVKQETTVGATLAPALDVEPTPAQPAPTFVDVDVQPVESQENMDVDALVERAMRSEEGREMLAPLLSQSRQAQSTQRARSIVISDPARQPSQRPQQQQQTTTQNRQLYDANNAYPLDPNRALNTPDVLIDPTYQGGDNVAQGQISRTPQAYESGVAPFSVTGGNSQSSQNSQNSQNSGFSTQSTQVNTPLNSLGQGSVAVPQTPARSSMPAQTTGTGF